MIAGVLLFLIGVASLVAAGKRRQRIAFNQPDLCERLRQVWKVKA